jgi:hypothetical protein
MQQAGFVFVLIWYTFTEMSRKLEYEKGNNSNFFIQFGKI